MGSKLKTLVWGRRLPHRKGEVRVLLTKEREKQRMCGEAPDRISGNKTSDGEIRFRTEGGREVRRIVPNSIIKKTPRKVG